MMTSSEDATSCCSSEDDRPANVHVFASSSTLHGFSHIFARHHSFLRKFAWAVAFITSLTLLLFQSSNRIYYYMDYPHVTRLDEVTAVNLSFPSLTICNMNEFAFSKITKNDMYHVGQFLGFLDTNETLIEPSFFNDFEDMEPSVRQRMHGYKLRLEELTDFSRPFMPKGGFNMFEFYKRVGHSLDEYLLGCTYRGLTCNHTWFSEIKTVVSELTTQPPSSSAKTDDSLKPSDIKFFADNTTFHGINHFVRHGKFTLRKFLWAAMFFTSLFLFLLQAYDRYAYYRTNPHVTKLDELEDTKMMFPAVTICNLNSFRLSQVTTDDYYYAGEILGLFRSKYEIKDVKYKDNKTWPLVYRRVYPIISQKQDFTPYSPKFNMFEFYNRTGHALPDMVLKCNYRGKTCRTLQDWVTVYTRYGKCYTFNSGQKYPPLKTLKGGIDNGLELLLDTQQNDYMPVWDESDEISVEAGFKVQIHVQEEPPFIHELGFGVSPGFQTLVATQEQRITFLPLPWGTCVKEFDKEAHSHFDTYSISACRISCETRFVVENCKCKMVHMPGNYSYCSPEQYKICGDGALDFLVKKDEEYCVCTTPCNVTRYNLQTSTLQLPSTQATSYMAWKYNVTERYVRDNFVKLNIFFEALNYETIEQKVAYEMAGLLGDIGGQMGLFIGASILTILELFDYIYEVIKDKTWGRRLRKPKDHSEQRVALTATSDNEALSNVVSPVSQYHVIPGTVSLTTERPNNFNVEYGPLRHHYMPPNKKYLNGLAAQTYPTMPFRSSAPNYNYNRKYENDDDYPPPPPPQYMGQSMMTLRPDHNGINDRTVTGRMERGGEIMGNREVSLSYNDLLNLPESNGYTHHDNMMQTAPRQRKPYQTSIPTMSQYDTPTRYLDKEVNSEASCPQSTMYAGPSNGVYGDGNMGSSYDQPSMKNHGYMSNDDGGNVALLTSHNDTYTRPMSPTFPSSYSRTMETDIH